MKRLRFFILVLMTVLLPLRGAVAATMLCAEGGGAAAARVVAQHGAQEGPAAAHALHADHAAAHHHASGEASHSPASGEHAGTCQFCASGGCMTTIVGTLPPLTPSGRTAAATFPALTVPAPAFESDGLDRPPRTL